MPFPNAHLNSLVFTKYRTLNQSSITLSQGYPTCGPIISNLYQSVPPKRVPRVCLVHIRDENRQIRMCFRVKTFFREHKKILK